MVCIRVLLYGAVAELVLSCAEFVLEFDEESEDGAGDGVGVGRKDGVGVGVAEFVGETEVPAVVRACCTAVAVHENLIASATG